MAVFSESAVGNAGGAIFSQDRLLVEVGQTLDGYTLGSTAIPQINNAGQTAIVADLLELETFFKKAVISPDGVILKPGDTIEGMMVEEIIGLSGVAASGDVVIHAITNPTGSKCTSMIVTQDRILFVPGADLDDLAGTKVVLNNRDQLALLGAVALEEGGFQRVLYAGGQAILSEGDVLDGKVITRIYPNFDMNDPGDVAFRVQFEGRERPRGIILAITVPEPTTWALLAAGCLMAMGACRWRP